MIDKNWCIDLGIALAPLIFLIVLYFVDAVVIEINKTDVSIKTCHCKEK